MAFDWRNGVHLQGSDLWFDAARSPGLTFVSHGGVRASGTRLLASQPTVKVMRALGRRGRPLAAALGRPVTFGAHRVELLASGLLPGGAILRIERRGLRALFAGRIGREADARACDVLCLEVPQIDVDPFPSLGQLAAEATDETLVLLAPGLPEAWAAASSLAKDGMALRAHLQFHAALRALGTRVPAFRGTLTQGEALLWPLVQWSDRPPADVARPRPVPLPWAGASLSELASFARATTATDVLIVGRDAAEAARRMASEGVPARPIVPPDQLALFAEGASA